MSEEKKGIKGREDKFLNSSDDDHLSETSDGGYATQGPGSTHGCATSELDLELNSVDYVDRGLEVAASDIMIIEHLPDGTGHEQNSDELEPLVIYEHPSDLDEETDSQLPRTYFDNSCQEKKVSNFELNSLPKSYQKGKKSLIITDKKRGKKMREISKGENASDSHSNKLQVKDPSTQIYEFTLRSEKLNADASLTDKKILVIKCPEYGSDEFADVEDNARDSSDNGESFSDLQTMLANRYMTETFPSERPKQEQSVETMEEKKFDKNRICSSSSDSEREKKGGGGIPEEKNTHSVEKRNGGASCSYSHPNSSKREKIFSVPKTPEDGKKKKRCIMPTIAEESENERKVVQFKDNQPSHSKDNQPCHSKSNPLKMKAKVGIRKDKCNVCRVRLGLCAIRCRCGGYFCAKHRYDKEHNCSFDYKTMGAEEIRRNNPK